MSVLNWVAVGAGSIMFLAIVVALIIWVRKRPSDGTSHAAGAGAPAGGASESAAHVEQHDSHAHHGPPFWNKLVGLFCVLALIVLAAGSIIGIASCCNTQSLRKERDDLAKKVARANDFTFPTWTLVVSYDNGDPDASNSRARMEIQGEVMGFKVPSGTVQSKWQHYRATKKGGGFWDEGDPSVVAGIKFDYFPDSGPALKQFLNLDYYSGKWTVYDPANGKALSTGKFKFTRNP